MVSVIVQPTYWHMSKYIRVGGMYQYRVHAPVPCTAPHPGCGWLSWYQTELLLQLPPPPEDTLNVTYASSVTV